ncbi:hypothetical protein P7K49_030922 [Saguinus oedipus]|uniref:Uncharacterized protein n=1 Tax=Saguinus oedipus TaxID=9490 RepID=A0ABQ9U3J7_SAGOE|nr:hypothetical protein P7K49_030922 [Saguinus oedipus]
MKCAQDTVSRSRPGLAATLCDRDPTRHHTEAFDTQGRSGQAAKAAPPAPRMRCRRGRQTRLPDNNRSLEGFYLPSLRRTSLTPAQSPIPRKHPSRLAAHRQQKELALENSRCLYVWLSSPRPAVRDAPADMTTPHGVFLRTQARILIRS